MLIFILKKRPFIKRNIENKYLVIRSYKIYKFQASSSAMINTFTLNNNSICVISRILKKCFDIQKIYVTTIIKVILKIHIVVYKYNYTQMNYFFSFYY